jgi:hypothetical protein
MPRAYMYPNPRIKRDSLINILCMMMFMRPNFVVSSTFQGGVEVDKMPSIRDL